MARSGRVQPVSPSRRRLNYLLRRALAGSAVALVILALVVADRFGLLGRAGQSDWDCYHGRQFKVVRIVDGDTLHVNCFDGRAQHTVVRLWGVDTPETVKPNAPVDYFGPQSSRFTRDLAADTIVTLELCRERTRDVHHRLLAYVTLPDGSDLAERIIAAGYGYADPRFDHPRQRQYGRAQSQAMKELRGLWKGVTDDALPDYLRGRLRLPARPAATAPSPTVSSAARPVAGAR